MKEYQGLITGLLEDEYDKVTYVSEDHYIGYIEYLDETHKINIEPVYNEQGELKGLEIRGERASIGREWEIAYMPICLQM